METYKYAAVNEAKIYKSLVDGKGKKAVNRILMGTYVKIVSQKGDWFEVETVGTDGWMHKDDLAETMGLKIFFIDIGQGDGVLIEAGKMKILIDAGPDASLYNYLTKWQYTYLLKKKEKVHIDHVFITHFDIDHYKGVIKLLEDERFTFGTIYHPGILKFAETGNKYGTGLGDTVDNGGEKYLTTIFDELVAAEGKSSFNRDVTAFVKALTAASKKKRVKNTVRLAAGKKPMDQTVDGKRFSIEVLGPWVETVNGKDALIYLSDEGKTINGHSLVLRITFGTRTFLFGGDLNTRSEEYLMKKYGTQNPFEVDVAKSCHHGSADFTEKFLAMVNPYATVISSGDNEGHAHPRADALGSAGKYSKSIRPLVFSTELARSVNPKTKKIIYGLINIRCNGNDIHISQMKEIKKEDDLWDSYRVK